MFRKTGFACFNTQLNNYAKKKIIAHISATWFTTCLNVQHVWSGTASSKHPLFKPWKNSHYRQFPYKQMRPSWLPHSCCTCTHFFLRVVEICETCESRREQWPAVQMAVKQQEVANRQWLCLGFPNSLAVVLQFHLGCPSLLHQLLFSSNFAQ